MIGGVTDAGQTTNIEDRATQPMEAGGWVSQLAAPRMMVSRLQNLDHMSQIFVTSTEEEEEELRILVFGYIIYIPLLTNSKINGMIHVFFLKRHNSAPLNAWTCCCSLCWPIIVSCHNWFGSQISQNWPNVSKCFWLSMAAPHQAILTKSKWPFRIQNCNEFFWIGNDPPPPPSEISQKVIWFSEFSRPLSATLCTTCSTAPECGFHYQFKLNLISKMIHFFNQSGDLD